MQWLDAATIKSHGSFHQRSDLVFLGLTTRLATHAAAPRGYALKRLRYIWDLGY